MKSANADPDANVLSPVHQLSAETIAVAVAERGGEVRSLGIIPNRCESVSRLMRKLGKPERLAA